MTTGPVHRWGTRAFAVIVLCAGLVAVSQPVVGHGYPGECTPQAAVESTIHQDIFIEHDDRHVVAVPVSEGDRVYVLQRAQDGRDVGVWHRMIIDSGAGEESVRDVVTIRNASGVETSTQTVLNGSGTYSVPVENPNAAYLCIGNEVAGDTVSEPFQWEIRYAVNEQPDWWSRPTTPAPGETSPGPEFGPALTVGGLAAFLAVGGLVVFLAVRSRRAEE